MGEWWGKGHCCNAPWGGGGGGGGGKVTGQWTIPPSRPRWGGGGGGGGGEGGEGLSLIGGIPECAAGTNHAVRFSNNLKDVTSILTPLVPSLLIN